MPLHLGHLLREKYELRRNGRGKTLFVRLLPRLDDFNASLVLHPVNEFSQGSVSTSFQTCRLCAWENNRQ